LGAIERRRIKALSLAGCDLKGPHRDEEHKIGGPQSLAGTPQDGKKGLC